MLIKKMIDDGFCFQKKDCMDKLGPSGIAFQQGGLIKEETTTLDFIFYDNLAKNGIESFEIKGLSELIYNFSNQYYLNNYLMYFGFIERNNAEQVIAFYKLSLP